MNKSLEERMKDYEEIFRHSLPGRMPVILRLDGKNFSNYTKACQKPYDAKFSEVMAETASYLCQNIQGARLAYVGSDEISILLINYRDLNTDSWFGNNIQKMTSVAASMAGGFFSVNSWQIFMPENKHHKMDYLEPAVFDCRAFVLPKEEVCNYFINRQQSVSRNSLSMLAQSLYSHKEIYKKNSSELHELIYQKDRNWNDCPTTFKRGCCLVKENYFIEDTFVAENPLTERSRWVINHEIPIFTADRSLIENEVYLKEDSK